MLHEGMRDAYDAGGEREISVYMLVPVDYEACKNAVEDSGDDNVWIDVSLVFAF